MCKMYVKGCLDKQKVDIIVDVAITVNAKLKNSLV